MTGGPIDSAVRAGDAQPTGSDATPVFDAHNKWDGEGEPPLAHAEITHKIRRAIVCADTHIRTHSHPWLTRLLAHQDALGLGIWATCLATVVAVARAYATGVLPAYVAVVISAHALSHMHELEHDLIHHLYFRKKAWVQDVMFFGIWVAKLSLNPWTRRDIHLLHHRRSGQVDDVEERLLGLGIRNIFLRLAVAFIPPVGACMLVERYDERLIDIMLSVLVHLPCAAATSFAAALWSQDIRKANPKWTLLRGSACSRQRFLQRMDNLLIFSPFWVGALAWLGYPAARIAMVTWVLPNVVRHASLALMSSYSHYYDIPERDITYQNQILNHWALLPLQFFCCNFGAEHIIHHYVVGQPYYLRHLVRHEAWKVLIQNGARVNDFGIVWRANRWDNFDTQAASGIADTKPKTC